MELLKAADPPAGDSLLKLMWHHPDAIMCCSFKSNVGSSSFLLPSLFSFLELLISIRRWHLNSVQAPLPVCMFANQAGLDLLETTLVALQDLTLDKVFDEAGQKTLFAEFSRIMQQVGKIDPSSPPSPCQGNPLSFTDQPLVVDGRGSPIFQRGSACPAWGGRPPTSRPWPGGC